MTRASRYVCAVVALLVVTLLWVPAAARAMQPVRAAASAIRLNRGFDMPVDKQSLPPADQPATLPAAIARQEIAVAVVLRPSWHRDDALPDAPDGHAPDPLRGPPSISIV